MHLGIRQVVLVVGVEKATLAAGTDLSKVLSLEYWYKHDKTFAQGNDVVIEN
jgi:hypothetical protein